MLAASVFLAVAAVRSSVAEQMSHARNGYLIKLTTQFTVGGVNVPLALFSLYMIVEFIRFGARWSDRVAVAATDFGLEFHWSTFVRPISWSEVQEVRFLIGYRSPLLIVQLKNGTNRIIRGINNDKGAAQDFAARVTRRLKSLPLH